MKTCPKCHTSHENDVVSCDCGYTFPAPKRNLFQKVLTPVLNPTSDCPKCGGHNVKQVSRWEDGNYIELTYNCPDCHEIFTRRRPRRRGH